MKQGETMRMLARLVGRFEASGHDGEVDACLLTMTQMQREWIAKGMPS